MVPSPCKRRSFLRGMHQEGAVTREISSGNQVWVGQYGTTVLPQCCPCKLTHACSGRSCRKAKCTANSSRQLMCQSSRGPVQSPEAACPLHVAPQPVLEASVLKTICRDTCSRGTPAHRMTRSIQGLNEQRHS